MGAEDSLAGLADGFDLDRDSTAELKGLLVDNATLVAGELDRGTARAYDVLVRLLRPHFAKLAAAAVAESQARALIERGRADRFEGRPGGGLGGPAALVRPADGPVEPVRATPGAGVAWHARESSPHLEVARSHSS